MAEYPGYHNNGNGNGVAEATESHSKSLIKRITSHLSTLVPIIAILAATHSVIRLIWGTEAESETLNAFINLITRLPDAFICLSLSGITFAYWVARDGKGAATGTIKMFRGLQELIARADAERLAERDARQRAKGRKEGIAIGRDLERKDLGLPPKNRNHNEDAPQ